MLDCGIVLEGFAPALMANRSKKSDGTDELSDNTVTDVNTESIDLKRWVLQLTL